MGIQFGKWDFKGGPFFPEEIVAARNALSPYETEGSTEYSANGIFLLHLPFITVENEQERQPLALPSGDVLLWDGRLDNGLELAATHSGRLRSGASDAEIVAAAVEHSGAEALSSLKGDWSLSLWRPRERTLLLARDFLGTKTLYYSVSRDACVWSTLIDPLLSSTKTIQLEEEYIAGWFSHFPALHLSPFRGIHSVPPGHYVLICENSALKRSYWDFNPARRIFYRNDRDYEEHLRSVFFESVRRRMRARGPVLAELSGGMDSSTIVCVADHLGAQGQTDQPVLDTISCFDRAEPNWDESPFFELVERQRGKPGHHVQVDFRKYWHPILRPDVFAATPGSGINLNESVDYSPAFSENHYRVLLQGIGGDEILGGVPTALPELGDFLLRGHLVSFSRALMAWALASRIPATHLVLQTLLQFLPSFLERQPARINWLGQPFAKRFAPALHGYPRRFDILGPLPSFQANTAAFDAVRRLVCAFGFAPGMRMERRYPYLDRDLLEFVFAIPREQIVRANQRRSLMRRAFRGIVPAEILDRRRKGHIARGPLAALRSELPEMMSASQGLILDRFGIVDSQAFYGLLSTAARTGELPVLPVLRTFVLEAWLKNVATRFGVDAFSEEPQPGPVKAAPLRSNFFFG